MWVLPTAINKLTHVWVLPTIINKPSYVLVRPTTIKMPSHVWVLTTILKMPSHGWVWEMRATSSLAEGRISVSALLCVSNLNDSLSKCLHHSALIPKCSHTWGSYSWVLLSLSALWYLCWFPENWILWFTSCPKQWDVVERNTRHYLAMFAEQWNVVCSAQCSVVQYSAACSVMPYNAVQFRTVQCIILCCSAVYCKEPVAGEDTSPPVACELRIIQGNRAELDGVA